MARRALRTATAPTEVPVDDTDRELIGLLQADGRATYQSLSQRVGLSSEAVRIRVERLVRSRAIQVVGSVAPELLGLGSFALVWISIDGPTEDVAAALSDLPETDFVAATAGQFDLLVELVCSDDDALLDAIDMIRNVRNVRTCESFTYLAVHKYSYSPTGLPALGGRVGPAPSAQELPSLDRIDRTLVDVLREDGRTSYTDLAEHVGLTYPSTRRRVLRLRDAGALHFNTIVNPLISDRAVQAGIGIQVIGDVQPVADALFDIPEIGMLISTTGRYDLMAEITCDDKSQLADLVGSRLRQVPGVAATMTHPYLRIHKLAYTWSASAAS